jgi:SWI/SNF-related matrix-associated actin-dependent regulator of chromatin subfamily A member 5
MIDDDVIIQRGLEERTVELNTKYKGLNLDNLDNFQSDATIQQWARTSDRGLSLIHSSISQ